ncbi:RNA 2',3'-cyclic phosphodiesterase [Neobacillus cucumis]|uniref:RNA 2',3'-cyclic phosphodiesterase n=1 Tax=Neobacillus cucumis TaxID=1740721 RepID=A0A2N5H928_9BACI|nr:RNA 2',3'-cyclic phosphodiesterase [Neobacillus cucumis]PLS02026.1 RNA 2',3'-cyclic phosphodiesterase [Neobacillus cucumis]
MNQRPHFFFAVRIPEETKLTMKNHIERLKQDIPFSKWVHHMDLHITLAFLGSAEPEKLKKAENYVKKALKNEESFTLKINKLGIFGKKDSPRVFWADTESSEELNCIRKKVYSACETAGFQLETRPFKPHITLARKWKEPYEFQEDLLKVWGELQPEPLNFHAQEVVVYQTHLNQTPKYEAITIFPLQS